MEVDNEFWGTRSVELEYDTNTKPIRIKGGPVIGSFRLTSLYGAWEDFRRERGWGPHRGVDIAVSVGTPVRPVSAGRIYQAGRSTVYPIAGIYVGVDHGHGLRSQYLHLDSTNMQVGDEVTKETIIGQSGATSGGGFTVAPHLHLSMQFKSQWLDPLLFLTNRLSLSVDGGALDGSRLLPTEAIVAVVDATVPAWEASLKVPYRVELKNGVEEHIFTLDAENRALVQKLAKEAKFQ